MSDTPWPDPISHLDDLPDDLRGRVKAELEPGERLLWAEKAGRNAWDSATNYVGLLTFSAGFLGLCVVCMVAFFGPLAGRLRGIENLLFAAGVGAGFIAFCLLASVVGTLGSWSWRLLKRGRFGPTYYALTDRRAIAWTPVPDSEAVTVCSYPRRRSGRVQRVEYPDGSGDVVVTGSGEGESSWDALTFEGVADVRRVEALVRATLIGHDPVTLVP